MYKFVETRAISTTASFIETIQSNRTKCAKSILDFSFNNKRLKVLSTTRNVPSNKSGIVYWMSRNQRVDDNWGLLYAQALGLK